MCWQTNLAILVYIKPRAELIDQKNTRMGTFTFVTLTIVKPFEDPSKVQEMLPKLKKTYSFWFSTEHKLALMHAS